MRSTRFSIQLSVCNAPLLLPCLKERQHSLLTPASCNRSATYQSHFCFQHDSVNSIQTRSFLSCISRLFTFPKDFKSFFCGFHLYFCASCDIHVVILVLTKYFGLWRSWGQGRKESTEFQWSWIYSSLSSHASSLLFKYTIQSKYINYPHSRWKQKYKDTHSAKISYTSATNLEAMFNCNSYWESLVCVAAIA